MISGFIMCYVSDRPVKSGEFFRRRLARVAPPYWFITMVTTALIILLPAAFRTSKVTPELLLSSLAFIAWPHPTMHGALPLYLIGWTLNYEFAYTLMTLGIALNWSKRVWLAGAGLLVLVGAGVVLKPENAVASFYTNSILLEFLFGMLIWRFFKSRHAAPKNVALLSIALGVAALAVAAQTVEVGRDSWWRCIVWGLPSAAIVFGAVELERRAPIVHIGWLKLLGDASYAIYLVHFMGLGVVRLFWSRFPSIPDIVVIIGAVTGLTLASVIFYLLIEKPLTRAARRLLDGRARSFVKDAPAGPRRETI